MKKVQKQKKPTLENLDSHLHESKKEHAEHRHKMREADRQFRESMDESSRKLKESLEETARVVREVGKQLEDMGYGNGDEEEEYFQNAFTKNPTLNGEIFDTIDFNVKPLSLDRQTDNEYDIVMLNEKSVAIIEIKCDFELRKSKLEENLKDTLHKLEKFKAFYPEYKNHKFYQGIASLSFTKSVENTLYKEGIAVIKQVGDKMVINSENLKVF